VAEGQVQSLLLLPLLLLPLLLLQQHCSRPAADQHHLLQLQQKQPGWCRLDAEDGAARLLLHDAAGLLAAAEARCR
jgi:hypothetical protein